MHHYAHCHLFYIYVTYPTCFTDPQYVSFRNRTLMRHSTKSELTFKTRSFQDDRSKKWFYHVSSEIHSKIHSKIHRKTSTETRDRSESTWAARSFASHEGSKGPHPGPGTAGRRGRGRGRPWVAWGLEDWDRNSGPLQSSIASISYHSYHS